MSDKIPTIQAKPGQNERGNRKKVFVPATRSVALCGNPNSGKTTLFNRLTGTHQHTGNFHGVTVEKKEGRYKKNREIQIVDLPGIYSLYPYSAEEIVARDFIVKQNPDVIINIVEACNLKRNLYLTSQLISLGVPVVIAVNMIDEAEKQGLKINTELIEKEFGVKVFLISAAKKRGLDEMMRYVTQSDFVTPENTLTFSEKVGTALEDVEKFDAEAQAIFAKIDSLELVSKDPQNKKGTFTLSDKIDKVLTNKWLGIPIFAGIMALVFMISVTWLGDLTIAGMEWIFESLAEVTSEGMLNGGMPEWFISLIVDGIIGGVGAVLTFVPQIMILFGLLSVLEASGYMSRVAFMLDRLMRGIGLSGRSVISVVTGYGCSVPAIMSARTIKSQKQRDATIALVPFVPCSAKLPVFALMTTVVFGGNGLAATSMYFVGILAVIVGGLLLKAFSRKKTQDTDTFVFELSPYRAPSPKNVLRSMWEKGKAFIIKAGTIIFLMSIVIWLLQSFSWTFKMVDIQDSMLADIGGVLTYLFIPLGFGQHWEATVATLTGFIAKEEIMSSMEMLGFGEGSFVFTGAMAYSFMIFNLLATPCMAAIGAMFKEASSKKKAFAMIGFQMGFAYVSALIIYWLGYGAETAPAVFWPIFGCLLVAAAALLVIFYMRKKRKKGALGCCGSSCGDCGVAGTCSCGKVAATTQKEPEEDKK